jgi:NAD(P)-dependent dehydrogenase (short-subunit alcohol dehydrogenase family)
MQKSNKSKKIRPAQHQERPGLELKMRPAPVYDREHQTGNGRLYGRTALITGGDSGIGKSVAVQFAKEGADIAIVYLNEDRDARETREKVESYGRNCLLFRGDIRKEAFCRSVVRQTVKKLGRLEVLVNNAATQFEQDDLTAISTKQLLATFQTNVFSMFWFTREALAHMKRGASIINTASVTAYRGSAHLIDYASTKGAIVSFTRSLSANLADKGIRVNAVAPGPIWTPLIVSSFPADKVAKFGSETPLERAGEPVEVASCYVFLASEEASYMTGQVLHPNGGEIVNG